MTQAEIRRGLPVWLLVVAGVAGTVLAVWGLHMTAGLLGPILLAFVLTVTVHPLPGWLVGKGVPRKLAVFLSVVAAYFKMIGLARGGVVSVGRVGGVRRGGWGPPKHHRGLVQGGARRGA